MRRALILSCLLVLVPAGAGASVVLHNGEPGVVAAIENVMLDSEGRVWQYDTDHWVRHPEQDPPIPVDSILFWDIRYLISTDFHLWLLQGEYWYDRGLCPVSAVPEELSTSSASVLATPGPGPFRIAFSLAGAGPVSVTVYDATGREVRQLLCAELPAGEYTPAWDGLDGAGRELPSGVYLARIATPAGEESGRIVLAR